MTKFYAALVGILWGFLGVAKWVAPTGLARYLGHRFGVDSGTSTTLATTIGVAEAILGVAILVGTARKHRFVDWLIRITVGLALIAIVDAAVQTGSTPPCGCFGSFLKSTSAMRLIVAGFLLVLSTLYSSRRVDPASAIRGDLT